MTDNVVKEINGKCQECGAENGRMVNGRSLGLPSEEGKYVCAKCYYSRHLMAGCTFNGRDWRHGQDCRVLITKQMENNFYGYSGDQGED